MKGHFSGGYVLAPIRPGYWEYRPVPWDPFAFTRPNGMKIVLPIPFETDMASTPRALWSIPGYAPIDMEGPALIHDWLYQAHHDGREILGFGASNRVLGEACEAYGYSSWKAWTIREACDWFGKGIWKG